MRMDEPVKPGSRSANGCWTCRLRRKKCDESSPCCQKCQNLGLKCQGYGPRPEWMDRGPLERLEAEKVKSTIGRGKKKKEQRRRSSGLSTANQTQQERCLSIGLSNDATAVTSNTAQHPENGVTVANQVLPGSDENDWTDTEILNSAELFVFTDPSPISGSWDDCIVPGVDWHEGSQDCSFWSGSIDAEDIPIAGKEVPCLEAEVCTEETNQRQLDTVGLLLTCDLGQGDKSSTSGLNDTFQSPQGALALSLYTGRISPAQFPFDNEMKSGGFQWLQYLIFRSDPIRRLSSVLGNIFLAAPTVDSQLLGISDNYQNDLDTVDKVLDSIPPSVVTFSLLDWDQKATQTIVACTAVLQAIHIEDTHGISARRRRLLGMAAPYFHTLIDLSVRKESADPSEPFREQIWRINQEAAVALLGHLTWYDILGTLSSESGPTLGVEHCVLLEKGIVQMQKVCGCQNSVVKLLCEIAALHRWKRETEQHGQLSVFELTARGADIQEQLAKILEDLESQKAPDAHLPEKDGLTSMFARAAIIYLHRVISGPYPQLPEVRKTVMELVSSFLKIRDKQVSGYTVWPLCVTACFASEKEKNELEAIKRTIPAIHVKKCILAIEIGRECDRIRDQDQIQSDWVTVLKRMGTMI